MTLNVQLFDNLNIFTDLKRAKEMDDVLEDF